MRAISCFYLSTKNLVFYVMVKRDNITRVRTILIEQKLLFKSQSMLIASKNIFYWIFKELEKGFLLYKHQNLSISRVK